MPRAGVAPKALPPRPRDWEAWQMGYLVFREIMTANAEDRAAMAKTRHEHKEFTIGMVAITAFGSGLFGAIGWELSFGLCAALMIGCGALVVVARTPKALRLRGLEDANVVRLYTRDAAAFAAGGGYDEPPSGDADSDEEEDEEDDLDEDWPPPLSLRLWPESLTSPSSPLRSDALVAPYAFGSLPWRKITSLECAELRRSRREGLIENLVWFMISLACLALNSQTLKLSFMLLLATLCVVLMLRELFRMVVYAQYVGRVVRRGQVYGQGLDEWLPGGLPWRRGAAPAWGRRMRALRTVFFESSSRMGAPSQVLNATL